MEWGADIACLKQAYMSLIRSRMEYGSLAYGSASKSLLSGSDLIKAKALRICTGAVRSSLICALQVETGEMPLGLQHKHRR